MSVHKNTMINLVGAILPIGLMLLTVPLYLKVLGEARYGVLALVWLVLGYFSFLEMGMGKAAANQIAGAHNASAAERSEIFWAALFVNLAMGMVGAGILWLIGGYLINSVLKMPADFKKEALTALPWMISTLPLTLVSSVLNGALEGRNQFLAVNQLQITSNTIFQIVPLAVAYWVSPSLAWVIPAAVVSRASMNIFFFGACYWYLPLVTFPSVSMNRVRSLFTYGGWVAITGMAGPLLDTIERFVIGVVLGASAVTHYTLPMQLVGKLKVLPGSLARALFPVFSSRSHSDAHDLAVRATKCLAALMALAVIIVVLALRPVLNLWLGRELANITAPIGELLLVGVWINSVAHIPYFYLQATGRPDLVAKLHVAELIPYVLLVWLAIVKFGVMGAALVWVLRCFLEALILFIMSGIARPVLINVVVAVIAVVTTVISVGAEAEITLLWRGGMLLFLVTAGVAVVFSVKSKAKPIFNKTTSLY
jgi:O-antigen/teichoic acid export membrane protein